MDFFYFYIFAAFTLKFSLSFSSSFLFGVIDLLIFTNIDGRIMPRWRCSCSLSYGGSKRGR
jgi:hypothetical protein